MADIGQLFLMAALALAVYSVVALVAGTRRRLPELVASGHAAAWGTVGLVVGAFALLVFLLVVQDFSVAYVVSQTAIGQPLFYTITGVWGGQEGSLLWWLCLLCLYSGAAMWFHRSDRADFMAYTVAVLMGVAAFFLIMLNFESHPFASSMSVRGEVPPDGRGLNPLLQNPSMILHPPMLYAGFVGFSVPFAFAMAALLSRHAGAGWIRLSRRWTLWAWTCLSIGIGLGGHWAYNELGWGGYWAWDPVENASLMPWLVGTAFLHSVMVQEHRGMLKVWNVVLIILCFTLSIFGTFLTRSGILESIHAFAEGNIGYYFLTFLALALLGTLWLLFDRLPLLRADNELDALVSRETAFMVNNIIFVGMAFAVFWGTIYPIVSEAATGQRVVVGAPYFNAVVGPILLGMLFLMGVAPLLPWRRASRTHLVRHLVPPVVAGLLALPVLMLLGVRDGVVFLALGLVVFVLVGHIMEFWRGWRAEARRGTHPLRALGTLVGRNRRRYGGYIIHLGITVMALGIVVSSFYRLERDVTLAPGEQVEFAGYTLVFNGVERSVDETKQRTAAPLVVRNAGGLEIATTTPAIDFYFKVPPDGQRETEPDVKSFGYQDLYTVLTGVERDGTATFKLFLEPLIALVWSGGLLLIFGSCIVVWPDPREGRILERVRARDGLAVGA